MTVNFQKAIQKLEATFIRYPASEDVEGSLDHLFSYGMLHEKRNAKCLVLVGPSGSGKTSCLKRFAGKYPDRHEELRDVHPILFVDVPSTCTVKNLAEEILIQLNDPPTSMGTLGHYTARVHHQMRMQGVQMLILDECQHLVQGNATAKQVANWVKHLLNERVATVVLSGTPEMLAVLEASKELKRRCLGIVTLNPLDWNNPFDFKMFHTFLANYEKQLPFPAPSCLTAPAMALRFYSYSKGVIGVVVQVIIKATIIALHRGKERLDDEVLLQASDSLLVPSERPNNPFRCSDLPPPQELTPEPIPGRQTRLRRGRKAPNPTDVIDGKVDVSEVLFPVHGGRPCECP